MEVLDKLHLQAYAMQAKALRFKTDSNTPQRRYFVPDIRVKALFHVLQLPVLSSSVDSGESRGLTETVSVCRGILVVCL